jgi:hypothetical protein
MTLELANIRVVLDDENRGRWATDLLVERPKGG